MESSAFDDRTKNAFCELLRGVVDSESLSQIPLRSELFQKNQLF